MNTDISIPELGWQKPTNVIHYGWLVQDKLDVTNFDSEIATVGSVC